MNNHNHKKIETKEDLYEKIQQTIDSYYIIKELEEFGEDVEDAMKINNEKIKKLIDLGKKQFNLTNEEINNIFTSIEKITNKHK